MLGQAVRLVMTWQGRALKHRVAAKMMDRHTKAIAVQNHLAMIAIKPNQRRPRNQKATTTMMGVENQRRQVQKKIKVTKVEIAFLEATLSFSDVSLLVSFSHRFFS